MPGDRVEIETVAERSARKASRGVKKAPPTPDASLLAMDVQQLNALSDELDVQAAEVRKKKREVAAARAVKLAESLYDHWGMTAEQYTFAKATARDEGLPLVVVLNKMRSQLLKAVRDVQVRKVLPVEVGSTAK